MTSTPSSRSSASRSFQATRAQGPIDIGQPNLPSSPLPSSLRLSRFVIPSASASIAHIPLLSSCFCPRLILSDGTHFMQSMLATQLNEFIETGRLERHSLMRLNGYAVNNVQNRKSVTVPCVYLMVQSFSPWISGWQGGTSSGDRSLSEGAVWWWRPSTRLSHRHARVSFASPFLVHLPS